MNRLLLDALNSAPVARPPVWLMRQAGRYMPQYRALRERHTLWQMFHEPELAAAVTKQPIEQLGVDAAILFSDILVIAEALGLQVVFPDKGGPRIEPAIHTAAQVRALPVIPPAESLAYVMQTIRLLQGQLDVPLIGFSGGPFTVASYLIDSSNHNAFARTLSWMQEDPVSLHELLAKITAVTIDYLLEQIKAGVDALQIFDSWANKLDDLAFEVFCVPYLRQIVEALRPTGVPVILFCRDSSLRAASLAQIRPAAISFDWHLPMKTLRQQVPAGIAVQGNLDPAFLKLSQPEIEALARELLFSMRGERGFIVNLGHGVTPDIPFEHVRRFVKAVTT